MIIWWAGCANETCAEVTMHILGQTGLGLAILALLAALVAVKHAATGSIMQERLSGGAWLWLIHLFNMFFLLIANPLAGVLLVTHYLDAADVTRVALNSRPLLLALEIGGRGGVLALPRVTNLVKFPQCVICHIESASVGL